MRDITLAAVNCSRVGDHETGDQPEQRGLSAAGRTQQRNKLALGDTETYAVDGCHVAKALADAVEHQSWDGG